MRRALPTFSPAIVKTAAAIAALIVSYLILDWIDLKSASIAEFQFKQLEMATISAHDIAQATTATYTVVREPFRMPGPFAAARISFQIDNPHTADVALFIRRVRDNYAVYVNGKLASPIIGEISTNPTLDGAQPRLTRLLPSHLRPGSNTLHIIVARNLSSPFLREVYFGPAIKLEPAYRHSIFIMRDLAEFALVAAMMVILFAIALSSIIQNPSLVLTIALTLSYFILRELHTLWLSVAWTQTFRDGYLLITASAVWASCAALVNVWTSGKRTTNLLFLALAIIACTAITLAMWWLPIARATELSAGIETIVELITFAFMATKLVYFYAKEPASAAIEIFAAIVCLMMAIASIATQTAVSPVLADFLSVQGDAFVQFGVLSIITFIAAGLARQGINVYQLAALNNETLSCKVAEKEREIQRHHLHLQSQEAERVLTKERSRIMSDVHDGIGSQLLGLLIQARAGGSNPEALVEGLQTALDDLYLVVDSLDIVEGSLDMALGAFRTRIEPKCKAAGVTLHWSVDDSHGRASTSPTVTLQICRILQEAVSNAIRHGKATELRLSLRDMPKGAMLRLEDNGGGFSPAAVNKSGRGLNNMRKRATAIGAQLEINSSKSGTCISLTLPA